MSFTNYLENELLDHTFKTDAAYTSPNLWVALSTDVLLPTDGGTCSEVPLGVNNYTRKYTATGVWNAAVGGTTTNASQISFNQASGNWGTISAFELWDAGTGGNMLMFGTLTIAKVIQNGDTPSFAAGNLKCTLD